MSSTLNLRDPAQVAALFERAAAAVRSSRYRNHSIVKLPATGRLILTGDLHDHVPYLNAIIKTARLEASPHHHIVLHEIIHGERLMNGMDFSHRTLARIAELIINFPGQVHVVLANHELAQMTRRGVSKGAGDTVRMFEDALEHVFGDDCEIVGDSIRAFIRALPLALVTASGVLVAHSLPAPHAMEKFDLAVFDRDLADDDYLPPHGAAHLMVWGRKHTPDQIESLAAAWNVKLFCLGHEHAEMGVEVRPGLGPDPVSAMRASQHVILNSDHERGVIIPLDLSQPAPSAEDLAQRAIYLATVQV